VTHPLVGNLAPDFTLKNQNEEAITLSDLRGTPVLVVFAPFAFSPLFDEEIGEIRDSGALRSAGGVRVLVVTCDSVCALAAWAEKSNYKDDLLSDYWPHGEVSRWYGIFNPRRGIAIRASFLIGGDGVVTWAVIHAPDDPRSIDDYLEAIKAL
jgi:peroxiredoxin